MWLLCCHVRGGWSCPNPRHDYSHGVYDRDSHAFAISTFPCRDHNFLQWRLTDYPRDEFDADSWRQLVIFNLINTCVLVEGPRACLGCSPPNV